MNKKNYKNKKSVNLFLPGGDLNAIPKMDVLGGTVGALGGVASLVGSGINNLKVPELKPLSVTANNNDDLMSQWGNYNKQKLEKNNVLGSTLSGVSTGVSAGVGLGPWGAAIGGVVGGLSNLFTAKKGNKLRAEKETEVNNQQLSNFDARADGISQQNLDMNLANYSAFGGNLMADGGFTNGITSFNEGGTHEQNPNSGVPQGIGQNGKPNLVEEGEVKFKDYIYSNRLTPSRKLLEDTKLPTKYEGKTFGDIANLIQKESEERPNDPISKNGLNDSMDKLKQAQEVIKLKKQQREQNKMQMEMLKQGIDPNTMMQQPQQEGMQQELPQEMLQQPEQQMMAEGGRLPNRNYFDKMSDLALKYKNSTPVIDSYSDSFFPKTTNHNKIHEDVSNAETTQRVINAENLLNGRPVIQNNKSGLGMDVLRYAPAVGSGIMALTDTLGLTNKPDYTTADAISNMKVKGERLGNYLGYKPMDRDYYQNKLNANAGATRAGLANASGGNRATYAASLLGADYNYGENMGNLAKQAEEYNLNQRQKVEDFNRGTNQFNASQSNWEQGVNTELATKSALLRGEAKNNSAAAKSANLGNFLDNMGAVGRESKDFDYRDALINSGVFGAMNTGMNTANDRRLFKNKSGNSKAKGGKLSKRSNNITF